jgi:hypothetical protein
LKQDQEKYLIILVKENLFLIRWPFSASFGKISYTLMPIFVRPPFCYAAAGNIRLGGGGVRVGASRWGGDERPSRPIMMDLAGISGPIGLFFPCPSIIGLLFFGFSYQWGGGGWSEPHKCKRITRSIAKKAEQPLLRSFLRGLWWCLMYGLVRHTEIEFLDINLTKDSSLLLHAIHSPFYWRILQKTTLLSGFKNP